MRSRRYKEMTKDLEKKEYTISEAVSSVKELANAKFDETVDIVITLGVDPKKSDQMVRGNLVLPHGTGKELKVAVLAEGEDLKAAQASGADYAGKEQVIEMIEKGDFDFDVLIATPDCMKDVGKFGKILGPRGLMPSPKAGTVVKDAGEAVKRFKKGQVEFKMTKNAVIHGVIGKVSFNDDMLTDNFSAYLSAVRKSRPSAAKGVYLKKVAISSTMGPSFTVQI
jgi:large subunit ribosomal protein L1